LFENVLNFLRSIISVTCSEGWFVCFEFNLSCRLSGYSVLLWTGIPCVAIPFHSGEIVIVSLTILYLLRVDLIFSSKSLLASRLFSSSVLISRFFASKAVFNCVVSSVSSFKACRKLSTCEFESAADCNCTAYSLTSFSLLCSLSMCSSQLPNAVTLRV
jgi:hypothetical protein